MRIAIPVADGRLNQHFGHSRRFAVIDVNRETREIVTAIEVDAPEHQPGLLPFWLKERGVGVVIAGGMGTRAQNLFAEAGVEVFTGVEESDVNSLVSAYLSGTLVSRPVTCHHH